MATFINETGLAAQVINGMNGITGSIFLTLLTIALLLMLIAFLFRIPLEFTVLLILPLFLTYSAFYGDFIAVTGALLVYAGILLAKNFFFSA